MAVGIPMTAKLVKISVIDITADIVPMTTEDVRCVMINQKTYAEIVETIT